MVLETSVFWSPTNEEAKSKKASLRMTSDPLLTHMTFIVSNKLSSLVAGRNHKELSYLILMMQACSNTLMHGFGY